MLFAVDPPPDPLGDALKIVQIAFYGIAGVLAVLTYRVAIKGWLTPTNTEYQKRVMDRLAKLSEDLYAEFDRTSVTHWAGFRPIHAAVAEMNAVFENNKEELLGKKKWCFGIPHSEDIDRLQKLLEPIRSDPFIPEDIREEVIDLLENRLHVMCALYFREFEKYSDGLAKGKQKPLDEDEDLDAINKIHNRVVDQLNKQGCGITSIENAVHDIRGKIQDYFDQFNPHGAGKGQRKRHEQPPGTPR